MRLELRCGCIVRLALGVRFWFVKVVPGFAQAILSAAVFHGPPWLEIGLSVDAFGLATFWARIWSSCIVEECKTLDDGKNPVMLYRLGAYGDAESPDSCHESPSCCWRLQKCRILARQVALWRRFRRHASAEAAPACSAPISATLPRRALRPARGLRPCRLSPPCRRW